MIALPHCYVSNSSATIERLFVFRKRPFTAHGRYSASQHAERENREFRSAKCGRSADVHVRADGLRLRSYRELPHVRVSRHFAAVPEAARIQAEPRDEPDGREIGRASC